MLHPPKREDELPSGPPVGLAHKNWIVECYRAVRIKIPLSMV